MECLWSKNTIGDQAMMGYAIHPSEDLIWAGGSVLRFSSGEELVRVKDLQGFKESYSPVWMGSDRVAQINIYHAPKSESDSSSDGTVRLSLWDARAGNLLAQMDAPYAVWIAVSPDGKHLAEAVTDKRVRIRNAETLEVEMELRVHEHALTGVAWHPLLPMLITAAKDGTIRIWSFPEFKRVEEMSGHSLAISRLTDYYESRIEVTADGEELNLYSGGIHVYHPESFVRPK